MGGHGVDYCDSGQGPMSSYCEDGNEPCELYSIEDKDVLIIFKATERSPEDDVDEAPFFVRTVCIADWFWCMLSSPKCRYSAKFVTSKIFVNRTARKSDVRGEV